MSEWSYRSIIDFYVKVLNAVRENPGSAVSEIAVKVHAAPHVTDRALMLLENRYKLIKSQPIPDSKDKWANYLTEEFESTLADKGAPITFEDYEVFAKRMTKG